MTRRGLGTQVANKVALFVSGWYCCSIMASSASSEKSTKKSEAALLRQIAELEQTIARLESEAKERKRSSFTQFMRRFAISLLVLLCALSSSMSVSSIWVKRNIINTDVWVEKTSQLIEDPAIRKSVSTALADQIFTQADVQGRIANILPEQIDGLAAPLANNIETTVSSKINEAMASEQFTDFWAKANRSAHAGIMQSIENGGVASQEVKEKNLMYLNEEQLVLNLKPVFAGIQDRLVDRGLTFVGKINIERIAGQLTLAEIKHMPAVLMAIDIINKTAFIMPVLAVLFGAGAIALSRNRRRAMMTIGWSIAALMVLLVQTINLVRYPLVSASLDALASAKTEAAAAVFSIITSDLIVIARTFLVLAALIILAAFLTGPSKAAVYIKTSLGKLMRTNQRQSGFVRWVHDNAGILFASIGTITALLLIFPLVRGTPVYPITVVGIAVLMSFLIAVIKKGGTQTPQNPTR